MSTNLLEKALLISSDIHTYLLSIFYAGKPKGFLPGSPGGTPWPQSFPFRKKDNECRMF
jgi:hypothetical protein